MKRGKQIDSWYPFYIDKWQFGSARHELIITPTWAQRFPDLVALVPPDILAAPFTDLRGIYVDLLTLSKKDAGYIRANETTAYPLEQLAGMWCIPIAYLKATIEICLHASVGKLKETAPGIFYISSTETYKLSDRWKREKSANVPKQRNRLPKRGKYILKDIKGEDIIEDIKRCPPPALSEEAMDLQFGAFWAAYPKDGREAKKEARRKFGARCKEGDLAKIIDATNNYNDFLRYERTERHFERRAMGAKTFLGDRWKEFVGLSIKNESEIGKSDRKLTEEEKRFYKVRAEKEADLREKGIEEKELRDQMAEWSREYWGKK